MAHIEAIIILCVLDATSPTSTELATSLRLSGIISLRELVAKIYPKQSAPPACYLPARQGSRSTCLYLSPLFLKCRVTWSGQSHRYQRVHTGPGAAQRHLAGEVRPHGVGHPCWHFIGSSTMFDNYEVAEHISLFHLKSTFVI